ncbi:MAG: hypothetical protein GKS06_05070 [Acidobacteria bacterium]|nr:hypothetical protein [Acidobacteriota bacterium]
MGLMDRLRGKRGTLGIELGSTVAAAQVVGDDAPTLRASGQSGHAGLEGAAMGSWLEQWLDTIGSTASSAHAVVVDDDSYHYLVTMPQMDAKERHLAAGAEIRKLSPVPAGQLAYSHVAVGTVEEDGVAKDRVLIAAVERDAVSRATDAIEGAGLEADLITTVPMALVDAHRLLPSSSGGTAIAYLSTGRSFLLIFQDGALELVRDFVLRSDDRDFDPAAMTDLVTAELRRSFLYFGQRAQGAKVDRLVLTGPMSNMTDVAARLREGLGISVEPFDVSSALDLGNADPYDQPALATAIGASSLGAAGGGNLRAPEELTERTARRAGSWLGWVAAALLLVLAGLAIWAFVDGTFARSRADDAQARLVARQTELQNAQNVAAERINHSIRQQLLEEREFESTLLESVLQRVAQRVPENIALYDVILDPVPGSAGATYWDVQISGLALGSSRAGSQSSFARFYAVLESDPLVSSASVTEGLSVGDVTSRSGVVPQRGGRERAAARQASADRRRMMTGSGQTRTTRGRTTFDELPPFAPTPTSVEFVIELRLKAVSSGEGR